MNLANYSKIEATGGGKFIKFENTGETRFLRFLYESGGNKMGEDVVFYRKKWDDVAKKYVMNTPEGQLVAALKAIEYDEDGSNPRLVRWERSAYFCKTVLLPMWKNYPRIIDGVWKITATSPKTLDASYSVFPVMSADTIKYPIIEEVTQPESPESTASKTYLENNTQSHINTPANQPATAPVSEEAKTNKKYWM